MGLARVRDALWEREQQREQGHSLSVLALEGKLEPADWET